MSIQLAVQDKEGPMLYADGAIIHRLFLFGPMVPNSSVSVDARPIRIVVLALSGRTKRLEGQPLLPPVAAKNNNQRPANNSEAD